MIAILEAVNKTAIPNFVPANVLWYAQDTGDLWIGTGSSEPPNVLLVQAGGSATPGGTNGEIQYNELGAFAGSGLLTDSTGDLTVPGFLAIDGILYDSTSTQGAPGQVLESTGAGTQWVTATSGGAYLPLTGGTLSGTLTAPTIDVTSIIASTLTVTTATVSNLEIGQYGDANFSRISGGLIAVGDGPIGDETGGLIMNALHLGGPLSDSTNYAGANGELLASTGSKIAWVTGTALSTLVVGALTATVATITALTAATATITALIATTATVTTETVGTETVTALTATTATIATALVATATVSGAGYVSVLTAPTATITTLSATTATVTTLVAPTATITTLSATTATITTLVAPTATITTLSATTATVTTLVAPTATITTANITTETVTALTATTATIATALVATATVSGAGYVGALIAPTAIITTLTAATATVSGAGYVSALTAPTATITTLSATTATVIGPLTIGLTSYTTTTSPSPLITIAGSYMKTSVGPVYAEDSWTIQNVIGSAGPNNPSNLVFTHVGADSTGDASVLMPNLTVSAGNVPFAGSITPGDAAVARSASSGLIAFGTSATVTVGGLSYWYWDGTNMNLGAGGLALAAPYGFTSYGATIKGNCAISTQLNVGTASAVMTGSGGSPGDMSVARSANTGVVYFGSSATSAAGDGTYWYWDGNQMNLGPGGILCVGGTHGSLNPGDISASRSASSGLIAFGTNGSVGAGGCSYWYWDGTNMNLGTGAGLVVPSAGGIGAVAVSASSNFYANGTGGVTAGSHIYTTFTFNEGLCTAVSDPSDSRLKTNTLQFTRGLSAIQKIDPISFNWNDEAVDHMGLDKTVRQYGFVAQNVETAIPEAIGREIAHSQITNAEGRLERKPNGKPDYKTVDTRTIVAALVNAVKELSAKVEALEAKSNAEVRLGSAPVAK